MLVSPLQSKRKRAVTDKVLSGIATVFPMVLDGFICAVLNDPTDFGRVWLRASLLDVPIVLRDCGL
jgi:hypothetical protein